MWRPVKGYEGLYEVSNSGEIKSLPRNGTRKEPRIIKNRVHKSGYVYCSLNKDGRQTNHQIHRLVAAAFILNPDNKPQVNHKNGIKTDNRVENLEWVTQSENALHSIYVLGHCPQPPHNGSKHDCKPIICVETGEVFESRRDAERKLGFSKGSILHALKGKVPRAYGLHWAYLAEPSMQNSE